MSVLYRKYRPQTFADVTGQEHVTRTLVAQLAAGRVAHAYLFAGPRGVGKTTTARLLAKAVNCTSRQPPAASPKQSKPHVRRQLEAGSWQLEAHGIPCNACDRCTDITAGRCLDVVEMDAASHTQVEKVREGIIETVRIVPSVARMKVFIIDEVHMLSQASFNALLKTIEEPPAHALFILATTELHKVPETIRSRCQHFAFRRVATDALIGRLHTLAGAEHVAVEDAVVAAVARAADGSVRDAETMLGQLLALGGDTVTLADASVVLPRSNIARARALVDAVLQRDLAGALGEIHQAQEEGFDPAAYTRDIIAAIRERIHASLADNGPAWDPVLPLALARVNAVLGDTRSEDPFLALEVAVLLLVVPAARAEVPSPPALPSVADVLHDRAVAGKGGAQSVPQEGDVDAERALAAIRSGWTTCIARIAEVAPSLPYLLEGGRPQRMDGNMLTIGFRYKLYAEKVRDPKAAGVVADAIAAIVGMPVRIATTVVTAAEFATLDTATRPATGDAVADAALEVFGGRVVE